MNDDAELLRRYAEERAEDAFAALVQRHVNLVYSVALRQVNGDAHLAADATQLVFVDLARKARMLLGYRVLAGWLFTSTRYAAAKLVRTEQRRHAREQEAQLMQQLNEENSAARIEWERVRPVLDDVIGGLGERDREAILLRFFEGRDYASVGARLDVPDNTARMRVDRALEKLRVALGKRGVTSTSAALAAALANQAVIAAPAGLAASVTGAALAGGGAVAATATAAGVAAGVTTLAKFQVGISGVVAAAVATGFMMQVDSNARLRDEIAALQQENGAARTLQLENRRIVREATEAAELRRDDAAFAELQEESARLRSKLQKLAATEEARATAAARVRSMEVFDISTLDRQPKPQFQARPEYPLEQRAAGTTGDVVVDFIVDAQGNVQNAHAVRSSNPVFEPYAVDAVRRWRFEPGQKNGRVVATHLQVPIVFSMSQKSPPTSRAAEPAQAGVRPNGPAADPFVTEGRRP